MSRLLCWGRCCSKCVFFFFKCLSSYVNYSISWLGACTWNEPIRFDSVSVSQSHPCCQTFNRVLLSAAVSCHFSSNRCDPPPASGSSNQHSALLIIRHRVAATLFIYTTTSVWTPGGILPYYQHHYPLLILIQDGVQTTKTLHFSNIYNCNKWSLNSKQVSRDWNPPPSIHLHVLSL